MYANLRGRIYVCSRTMSARTACKKTRGSPYTDNREICRSALANGNVLAHSLITITANHPKNPTKGTNKDHASQGRERRMAILAPKRSTGNTSAIHLNLGVPAKKREIGTTTIAATTSHAGLLRTIPITDRAIEITIAGHPNRIGHSSNIFRSIPPLRSLGSAFSRRPQLEPTV